MSSEKSDLKRKLNTNPKTRITKIIACGFDIFFSNLDDKVDDLEQDFFSSDTLSNCSEDEGLGGISFCCRGSV